MIWIIKSAIIIDYDFEFMNQDCIRFEGLERILAIRSGLRLNMVGTNASSIKVSSIIKQYI